jgi:hypothetical protein
MKKVLLSAGYALSLLASAGAWGGDSLDLQEVVKGDARRALEIARKTVLEDLSARVPQLARRAVAEARPRSDPLPGPLVVEHRPPPDPAPGR